ncbi:MAG TPA: hypothetical protein VN756_07410 [Solirubrobacterales bacterium]|nr:hypothetical protein [Solirubrobacterales bacterium]
MPVPNFTSRSTAFVVGLVALCATLVPSSALAATTTSLNSAVAVGANGQSGVRALCTREAKRKLRRLSSRASTSTAATRKVRRTKAALQRRCVERRAKQLKSNATTPSASLAIGIDGGYSGWWDEEIQFRTALGAPVTRHEWDPNQPVNDQDDLVLAATTEVHTRIHALLGGNELGDANHYRDWVIDFIRRYGVGGSFWSEHPSLDASRYAITTFELGNEPYFGGMSPSEYADTVRPTLEAVQQLGLPAKLILPSYIYDRETQWIDTLYQRIPDLNSLFYAFADHPYWYGHAPSDTSGGGSPFGRIETLRAKMTEHGAASKPVFFTEYGESTANCGSECVSESVQADHIQEMIEASINRTAWKVEALFLYQLHDWATNSTSREQQFGLLRQDGSAKPAYAIARAAMQRYGG